MKQERIKQRYSRRQIAELVGCSASAIVQIERGDIRPSLGLARKLSLVLGKSIEALFFAQNPNKL